MTLHTLSIQKARMLLEQKEISSTELTRSVFERIRAVDESVGAYITVAEESAMEQAGQADDTIAKGDCSAGY